MTHSHLTEEGLLHVILSSPAALSQRLDVAGYLVLRSRSDDDEWAQDAVELIDTIPAFNRQYALERLTELRLVRSGARGLHLTRRGKALTKKLRDLESGAVHYADLDVNEVTSGKHPTFVNAVAALMNGVFEGEGLAQSGKRFTCIFNILTRRKASASIKILRACSSARFADLVQDLSECQAQTRIALLAGVLTSTLTSSQAHEFAVEWARTVDRVQIVMDTNVLIGCTIPEDDWYKTSMAILATGEESQTYESNPRITWRVLDETLEELGRVLMEIEHSIWVSRDILSKGIPLSEPKQIARIARIYLNHSPAIYYFTKFASLGRYGVTAWRNKIFERVRALSDKFGVRIGSGGRRPPSDGPAALSERFGEYYRFLGNWQPTASDTLTATSFNHDRRLMEYVCRQNRKMKAREPKNGGAAIVWTFDQGLSSVAEYVSADKGPEYVFPGIWLACLIEPLARNAISRAPSEDAWLSSLNIIQAYYLGLVSREQQRERLNRTLSTLTGLLTSQDMATRGEDDFVLEVSRFVRDYRERVISSSPVSLHFSDLENRL